MGWATGVRFLAASCGKFNNTLRYTTIPQHIFMKYLIKYRSNFTITFLEILYFFYKGVSKETRLEGLPDPITVSIKI
jgi:hypothetical protein